MAKKISGSVGKGGKNKVEDTIGTLSIVDTVVDTVGNPPPSGLLVFTAPASSTTESWAVAFPIGDEFFYDPAEFGPAVSIDYQLDVLPAAVSGSSDVAITLAVLQDETFVLAPTANSPSVDGSETSWTTLGQTGLRAVDFDAISGSSNIPAFDRPFQFGYLFQGEYSTTGLSVELGIDNMEATINTIPEPTSIVVALAMGATVLWNRWWRNGEETKT